MRASLCLSVAILACTDSGPATVEQPPLPPLTLVTPTVSVYMPPGWNALVKVSANEAIAHSGALALSVENLPAGVTGSFAPPRLTTVRDTAVLSLDAALNATPGAYTVTVRAVGAGGASSTLPLLVTVPTPSYVLSLETAEMTVPRNAFWAIGQTWFKVLLRRENGFTGPVALTLENVPPLMGVRFRYGATLVSGMEQVVIDLYGRDSSLLGTHLIGVRGHSDVAGTQVTTLRFTLY